MCPHCPLAEAQGSPVPETWGFCTVVSSSGLSDFNLKTDQKEKKRKEGNPFTVFEWNVKEWTYHTYSLTHYLYSHSIHVFDPVTLCCALVIYTVCIATGVVCNAVVMGTAPAEKKI